MPYLVSWVGGCWRVSGFNFTLEELRSCQWHHTQHSLWKMLILKALLMLIPLSLEGSEIFLLSSIWIERNKIRWIFFDVGRRVIFIFSTFKATNFQRVNVFRNVTFLLLYLLHLSTALLDLFSFFSDKVGIVILTLSIVVVRYLKLGVVIEWYNLFVFNQMWKCLKLMSYNCVVKWG